MKHRTHFLRVNSVAALLVCLVFGSALTSGCSPDKSVRTIFVQWKHSSDKLIARGLQNIELTKSEIALLSSQHVAGTLTIVGSQVHGQRDDPANQTRVVIVMQHQVDRPVKLRQPVSDAEYLQLNNEWKLLPVGTQTNDRLIWLEPNSQYSDQTMYWFQLPDGARQGKTAFSW